MYVLHIALHGDNERLHEEALKLACEAIINDSRLTGKHTIYRAWLERAEHIQSRIHSASPEPPEREPNIDVPLDSRPRNELKPGH